MKKHKKPMGEKSCGCCSCHEHDHEHDHKPERDRDCDHGGCHCHEHEEEQQGAKTVAIYAVGACVTALGFLPFLPFGARLLCAVASYLFFGLTVFRDMLRGFARGDIFSEFTLMCVASLGAFAIGEYADAAAVMYLYRLGEEISGGAYARSRKNVSELLAVAPEYANVLREGAVVCVEPHEVAIGETILVRVGDRIALDGTVCGGNGSADTSSVTGEAVPLSLYEGVFCPSGSLLVDGEVMLRVTDRYENSVVAKLAEAMRTAAKRKSSAEKKIARFARVFTPLAFAVVVAIALIGALWSGNVAAWVRVGLTVLVISCPCSLLLSVPLAYFAGMGAAAKRGIVFRGGEIMDRVRRLSALAFDKTGTLTESGVSFVGVTLLGTMDETEFLQLSYDVLLHSPHVAAASFCRTFDGHAQGAVCDVQIVGGRGILCEVNGKIAVFGNAAFLREQGMAVADCHTTAIFGALDGEPMGCLHFSSQPKPHAKEAIADLRALGVSRLRVLSGDGETAVAEACRHVGIDEWQSSLRPHEKLDALEHMMAASGVVGFCGDGLNDSAVIARADVGIAMGACGSALTVQAADVVIMDDDLQKLGDAIQIARRTERVANISIVVSLGIKLAVAIFGLVVASLGREMSMELAIVADVGAAVLAVLQSMRAAKLP